MSQSLKMFPRFTRLPAGPGLLCAPQLRDGRVCTGPRGTPGPLHVPSPRPAGTRSPGPRTLPQRRASPSDLAVRSGSRVLAPGQRARQAVSRCLWAEQTSERGRSARTRVLPRGPSRAASPLPPPLTSSRRSARPRRPGNADRARAPGPPRSSGSCPRPESLRGRSRRSSQVPPA